MFRGMMVFSLFLVLAMVGVAAENPEPPLPKVFADLGIQLSPADEIQVAGPVQGVFAKTGNVVEVVLAAKYSFAKQEKVSDVRAGYYVMALEPKWFPIFTCGPEAGDQNKLTGLPASPRGPYFFDPGKNPFGFFVQSANFNPAFSPLGETVCTQDQLNARIQRFGSDIHKAHIYPYKTRWETKPDWFILCWEFSTNNDNQDIITIVRGVRLVGPVKSNDNPMSGEQKKIAMLKP